MNDKVKGLIQLALVVAFIVGSFLASAALETERKVPKESDTADRILFVETQKIAPGPYQTSFNTTGLVEARAQINIVPEVSGRIVAVNEEFYEGGKFEADEVLFEIEPLDFKLELERLRATVAQARTAYNIAEAETDAATREWKMLNGDKAVPRLVARRPQKDEAWANLKAAKAELQNAELDLERTKFSLPHAGRVISSNLEIGQYVAAGQNYGEVFSVDALEIRATLEDQQLGWLFAVENTKIKITTTQQGKTQSYDGFLKRGVSSVDPQTRFAPISFGVKDEEAALLPGMFVEITVQGPELDRVLVAPASALQKEGIIWTLDEENALHAFEPAIVYADNEIVAVKNVNEPRNIVTSRVSGATDGMKARTADTPDEKPAEQSKDESTTP